MLAPTSAVEQNREHHSPYDCERDETYDCYGAIAIIKARANTISAASESGKQRHLATPHLYEQC